MDRLTHITETEYKLHGGTTEGANQYRQALNGITAGSGFKVTCSWKHGKGNECPGAQGFYRASKVLGIKIKHKHDEGILYVYRHAE
jgi:hypothetical protein